MYQKIIVCLFVSLISCHLQADNVKQQTAFSVLGEPKYPDNFTHFDYVNPAAPKGGQIIFAAIGTFDNFNRYAQRGNAAIRSEALYDALFAAAEDEIGSYYPLIAKSARFPDNFSWVEVAINPDARFHDNSPITASDVVFSFNKMMQQGVPQFRSYYKGYKVVAISPLQVRFEAPTPNRDKIVGLVTGLPIFPLKFWQQHDLADPLSVPPLGSGPYRISDYKMGQYVVYQRVKDYWAANLPTNRGLYNFDTIRYEYYLDDNVALEAFRAGAYDVRTEVSPKNWATQYQGKNFANGAIVKTDIQDNSAQNTGWLAFNITRPLFQDRRVRKAITLAFDFDWMNKVFYYNAYRRTRSYFQNTEYEAKQLPNKDELAWLTPLKNSLPHEVFGQIYQPPTTDGSGNMRQNLFAALELLQQAGWEIKNQTLVNSKSGEPFQFELMLLSGRDRQFALPFKHNLARLGIKMQIREVDSSQFNNRLRKRDFDMLPRTYGAMTYPQSALQIVWGSAYIDSTYNTPGVRDTAVDTLLQKIVDHQGQPKPLLSLGRALDRVLTWNYYMLPMWYSRQIHLAYWNQFSMPAIRPIYSLGLDSWWFDAKKISQLPSQRD